MSPSEVRARYFNAKLNFVEDFVDNYAFMESNYTALLNEFDIARPGQANMREMDGNVNRMKSFLITNIGADWATATAANQVSRLGIDSRGIVPWDEVRTAMTRVGVDSTPAFVARHVRHLTHTFFPFSP